MPGIEYKLVLFSYNMHNEDDFAKLTWRIQCANPIVPEDWKLHYEPFLHSDTSFNMSLTIEKEKVYSLQYKFLYQYESAKSESVIYKANTNFNLLRFLFQLSGM